MDSFQNASQLHDPVYGSQVTQNCWTYGIHLDNYLRFMENGTTLYLRKHTKSDSRPIEFYERQFDEIEFLRRQSGLLFCNGVIQVSKEHKFEACNYYPDNHPLDNVQSLDLLLIEPLIFFVQFALLLLCLLFALERCPLTTNIFATLQLVSLAHFAAVLKLLIHGQYSVQHGLRFESLFSFPLGRMIIETISSETAHSKTFIQQDVKILSPDLSYPEVRKITSICITGFLAFLAITHLCALVRVIVLKIRAAKNPKNSTTNLLNSGKDGKLAGATAKSTTSEKTTKPTTSDSEAASKSSTSESANASISTDSTSISIESESASKSPDDHAITVGEIEV